MINNTYTYSYYVYPNQTNLIDGSNTQIQFKLNQPEYRDWMINKNITEFTQIKLFKSLNQKSPTFQTEIKFEVGQNFVSMTQIELQEKGYIVAVIVNSNITNYKASRRLLEAEDRLGRHT